MTATTASSPNADGHSIALEAERRWALVVAGIIAVLVAMMIFTGVHWASMPPSRVETVDVRTLHLTGEFVESNLGTSVDDKGKVVVRLIAQQYSFEPSCIVVPAMPEVSKSSNTDMSTPIARSFSIRW